MVYLGHFAIVSIYIYLSIVVVYRVLSIYRVLPGFREFAVFEKIKRFFYIFFGWVLHRGGQGPGKGPNISHKTKGCDIWPPLKSQFGKRFLTGSIVLYSF